MDTNKMTIGAVQMNCKLGAPAENVDRALELLQKAAGVRVICFPELFTTGYHLELLKGRLGELAEPIPGPTTELFSQAAREGRVAVLGTIVEREGDRLFDSTFLIDAQGRLVGSYRKTHLYPAERCFTPGDRLEVFKVDGVSIGIAICFEHAFPPIVSTLALLGARIVFNPTAVPAGYEYLVKLRNRARAQDNQVFFVSANHAGVEGDLRYCGLSQIDDPRGEVLAQADGEGSGVILATVDLSHIGRERAQEPTLNHFRPELYRWKRGTRRRSSGTG